VLGGLATTFVVPMVSFCDIPLSEIKDHISKYGNYGIGMTKNWAFKQGLNPVLYMAQNSMLSGSYRTAWNEMINKSQSDEWTADERNLADVMRYIKNYEGDLVRKGATTRNYRFSDEREWRYVPPHSEDYEFLLAAKYYDDISNKSECDNKLLPLRLKFELSDIKYIIIDNDSEIGDFIQHLREAKGKTYSLHEVERLTTRILTVEQIRGDI
jgi:hypothetical protein